MWQKPSKRICRPLSSPFHVRKPGLSFFYPEKLVEFVCYLIREKQHGATGINALHVSPNNACHLRRGDQYPRGFVILPTGQFKYLFGEGFLLLRRQIGAHLNCYELSGVCSAPHEAPNAAAEGI